MAYSERSGLSANPATGDIVAENDLQQVIFAELAARDTFGALFGGQGIYTGGAAVYGDLPASGANYPAFRALVADDSGHLWPVQLAAATAMTFAVTSGACTAWLVIPQVPSVSPVMATGSLLLVTANLLVQLTVTADPAHAIKLGSGNVTASAFTDWTVDPAIMVAANASIFARRGLANTWAGVQTFGNQITVAQPQARMYLSGAQTITTGGSPQTVVWNAGTLVGITNGSGVLTIPADGAGTYMICGQIEWTGNATGIRAVYLYTGQSGSQTNKNLTLQQPPSAETFSLVFTRILTLANSDLVDVRVYHTRGSDLTIRDTPAATNVQVYRLG